MNKISSDILIIGAGPVGIFTIFEAGMMGLSCTIVDVLDQPGGQLTELYPEKPIYDIPGFPSILAGDLAKNLVEQADVFKPTWLLGRQAQSCKRIEDGFEIGCEDTIVEAKAIIIAAGAGMFAPRKPKIDGLDAFEGTSVFYAVRNKAQYAGKKVLIAGGGDSAVDWAIELANLGAKVEVTHRRPEFRAAEDSVRKMNALAEAGTITIHPPANPVAVNGANGQLESVTLEGLDGTNTDVAADVMLCFYGLMPELGPIANWGLNVTRRKVSTEPVTQKTSEDGIYAVGDIADYDGKMDLILTGFAEAAQACRMISIQQNPGKKFRLNYSTSSGQPGV